MHAEPMSQLSARPVLKGVNIGEDGGVNGGVIKCWKTSESGPSIHVASMPQPRPATGGVDRMSNQHVNGGVERCEQRC